MMMSYVWTKKKPTTPGWYWWRRTTGPHWTNTVPGQYQIVERHGVLVALGILQVPVSDEWFQYGQWAGPIEEPQEAWR
jgi:hypothetical protein